MTSTSTRPDDNVVIATKGLQDRNTNIIAGTTVENKGKLILREAWFQKDEEDSKKEESLGLAHVDERDVTRTYTI